MKLFRVTRIWLVLEGNEAIALGAAAEPPNCTVQLHFCFAFQTISLLDSKVIVQWCVCQETPPSTRYRCSQYRYGCTWTGSQWASSHKSSDTTDFRVTDGRWKQLSILAATLSWARKQCAYQLRALQNSMKRVNLGCRRAGSAKIEFGLHPKVNLWSHIHFKCKRSCLCS